MSTRQVRALTHKDIAAPALAKPSSERAFVAGKAKDLEPVVFHTGKIFKLATARQAPFEAFAEPAWYVHDSDFKLSHTGYDKPCLSLRTLLIATALVAVGLPVIVAMRSIQNVKLVHYLKPWKVAKRRAVIKELSASTCTAPV